jgi:hypothetical protein
MNLSELVTRFREEVDDPELPGQGDDSDSLWKDSEIYHYADLAQKQFARDTRLKRDATNASVVQLTVTAANPWVAISPLIIKIVRAKLTSTGKKMALKEFHEMDESFLVDDYGYQFSNQWETQTGEPQALVTDMEENMVRLAPTPTANDTIDLIVDRLPLTDITNSGSTLEFTNDEHNEAMILYMAHKAYRKQDADTYDKELSNDYLQLYAVDAAKHKRQKEMVRSRIGFVRYGGL